MYLLGVALGGFPWMSGATLQKGIPFWIKNLILQETSRAFQSRQWNERVKGIEPSYAGG